VRQRNALFLRLEGRQNQRELLGLGRETPGGGV
jgi:hypothetical protein